MFENILYKSEIPVIDGISIQIPTVGEVLEDEGAYFNQVSLLTSMPIDLMVPLDEMGVDFAEISEYDLFLRMYQRTGHTLDFWRFRYIQIRSRKENYRQLVGLIQP